MMVRGVGLIRIRCLAKLLGGHQLSSSFWRPLRNHGIGGLVSTFVGAQHTSCGMLTDVLSKTAFSCGLE